MIQIIAMGHKMPTWVNVAFEEYAKRLSPKWLELIEIPLLSRSKNTSIEPLIKREGERMLAAIPKQNWVIALEIKGKTWNTEQLAEQIKTWQNKSISVSLLIGGPEGLAPECLKRADQRWSLSPLTLPHPLVRIILIEQCYRTWSLLGGHPYHK